MPESHKFREDDAEINAAIEEAQRHFDKFAAALVGDSFLPPDRKIIKGALAKVRFHSPVTGSTEHLWVREVRFEGMKVVGVIANEPEDIPEVEEGMKVTLTREKVSDWFYWTTD